MFRDSYFKRSRSSKAPTWAEENHREVVQMLRKVMEEIDQLKQDFADLIGEASADVKKMADQITALANQIQGQADLKQQITALSAQVKQAHDSLHASVAEVANVSVIPPTTGGGGA